MNWPLCDFLASRQLNMACCPIPRCGSSTLINWWSRLHGQEIGLRGPAVARWGLGNMDGTEDAFMAGATVFAFVRDPWSRLVSAYLGKSLQPRGICAGNTFRQFVRHIAGGAVNKHWRPVGDFIPEGLRIAVHPVSEMSARLAQYARQAGSAAPIATYNAVPRHGDRSPMVADAAPADLQALPAFPAFQYFYDAELRDRVRMLYAGDIERFGFRWEASP